jgi:phage tail-like protein
MSDLDDREAVAIAFKVTVDTSDELGWFTQCDGLGCEVQVEQREEGGNLDFVHQLPGRIKFSNIKLTRVLNTKDADKVPRWIGRIAAEGSVTRCTAVIEAMTADGRTIATWSLREVIPVRWSGPSLSVDSNKPATETLELAHHGFLPS